MVTLVAFYGHVLGTMVRSIISSNVATVVLVVCFVAFVAGSFATTKVIGNITTVTKVVVFLVVGFIARHVTFVSFLAMALMRSNKGLDVLVFLSNACLVDGMEGFGTFVADERGRG